MIAEGQIEELVRSSGLRCKARATALREWDNFLLSLNYAPIMYASSMIAYQEAYLDADSLEDLSVTLLNDGHVVGIWPLTLTKVGGVTALTSQGIAVLPPLLAPCLSEKTVKALLKSCITYAEGLATLSGAGGWKAQQPFQGEAQQGLTLWHQLLMSRGAVVRVGHDLMVDLSLDLAAIRLKFRKSYRPLLSVATRLWNVEIVREADHAVWHDFRALHHQAAGRQTRSDETWEMQLDALGRGAAFLVSLRDRQGAMVGAGYFDIGTTEAMYSVAAYDRSLFDKPIGHLVQYRAIEEMKERGLRWYRIGQRSYPGDVPKPTDKELAIAEFKQGFATHMFPLFEYHLESYGIAGKAQSE